MVSVIVRIGYHREGVQTDKVKLAADREWEVRFQDRPHTLGPCVRFQLPPDIVRITSHMLRQQVAGVLAEIGKLVHDGLSCLTILTSLNLVYEVLSVAIVGPQDGPLEQSTDRNQRVPA